MAAERDKEHPGASFPQVLDTAAKLPGIRIDRAGYLQSALRRDCSREQIANAVKETPNAAGVPLEVITDIAIAAIRRETSEVTSLSVVAGIPGAFAMIATIPADLAQFFGHVLRVAQKLAYVYGWPSLFDDEADEQLDDAAEGILTLFVGVMFGVQSAQRGVSEVAAMIAEQPSRQLPRRALTTGIVSPVVKEVSTKLGLTLSKKVVASGLAKTLPVGGAIISGGITLKKFLPMAKKLQKFLEALDLAKPTHGNVADGSHA